MRSPRALGRSLSLSAPPQRFLHILSLGSKGASHKRITATPPSPHWAEPAHIADPIGDTHCRKEPIFEQEVISNSGFCNLFNQDPRRAHAIYTLQVPLPSLPPLNISWCYFFTKDPRSSVLQVPSLMTYALHPRCYLQSMFFWSQDFRPHKLDLEAAASSFTPPGAMAMWVLVE